ncbi:Uncharacterised protein [Mycobacteroides abscessus subsp. abscessus]|nr:Uncharacterised protein [Mycobacteroides abscessus subsp. abscessus]
MNSLPSARSTESSDRVSSTNSTQGATSDNVSALAYPDSPNRICPTQFRRDPLG